MFSSHFSGMEGVQKKSSEVRTEEELVKEKEKNLSQEQTTEHSKEQQLEDPAIGFPNRKQIDKK
jgi:hypothetical protein